MTTTWYPSAGLYTVYNASGVSDTSGIIDVSPYVPSGATSIVLGVTGGFISGPWPSSPKTVSTRLMPYGYNLSNSLDRAKYQFCLGGIVPAADYITQFVRMPIYGGNLGFFFAQQSSNSATADKILTIQLWGYEV
jgi:hypothetical protein